MYIIHDAHHKVCWAALNCTHDLINLLQGVTALACISDSRSLISGGGEGEVRVWEVRDSAQYLKEALKEHKGAITCIKIRKDDSEVSDARYPEVS